VPWKTTVRAKPIMSRNLNALVSKIRSLSEEFCENQMYVWPGFDVNDPNPRKFFKKYGIEFDGELFIRYPVKRTFNPIPAKQLERQEKAMGAILPGDYKTLLLEFGTFHLPGNAGIMMKSPRDALKTTQSAWCFGEMPLSALAISPYSQSSDGNSIGFLSKGAAFQRGLYEFQHDLRFQGDDPSLWTRKVSNSLADFLLQYLG
jgi:hypothetical protein